MRRQHLRRLESAIAESTRKLQASKAAAESDCVDLWQHGREGKAKGKQGNARECKAKQRKARESEAKQGEARERKKANKAGDARPTQKCTQ